MRVDLEHPGGSARVLPLRTWDRTAIKVWLKRCGLRSDGRVVDLLLEVTGGWPGLVEDFGRSAGPGTELNVLEALGQRLRQPADAATTLHRMGLQEDNSRGVLALLALHGPCGVDQLMEAVDGPLALWVAPTLRWARRLDLVSSPSPGQWTLAPLVTRLLAARAG